MFATYLAHDDDDHDDDHDHDADDDDDDDDGDDDDDDLSRSDIQFMLRVLLSSEFIISLLLLECFVYGLDQCVSRVEPGWGEGRGVVARSV